MLSPISAGKHRWEPLFRRIHNPDATMGAVADQSRTSEDSTLASYIAGGATSAIACPIQVIVKTGQATGDYCMRRRGGVAVQDNWCRRLLACISPNPCTSTAVA